MLIEEEPEARRAVNSGGTLELAWAVFDVVRSYVAIRKTIFRMSFRTVVPIPGIFKAVDYDAGRSGLAHLQSEIEKVIVSVWDLLHAKSLSPATKNFLTALEEYSQAVCETIFALSGICRRLQEKSVDANTYRWSEYRRDVAEHNALARRYGDLGLNVSALHRELQLSEEQPETTPPPPNLCPSPAMECDGFWHKWERVEEGATCACGLWVLVRGDCPAECGRKDIFYPRHTVPDIYGHDQGIGTDDQGNAVYEGYCQYLEWRDGMAWWDVEQAGFTECVEGDRRCWGCGASLERL